MQSKLFLDRVQITVSFYQGCTDFGLRFPSVRQYTTSPNRFAKQNDILMSVRAPVGSLNVANNDCCIGRGLAALNSKLGSPTHLYYILNDLKIAFEQRNAVGTTFGSITKDDLYSLPVVKPDNTAIKSFEIICAPIFNKQMAINYEIDLLTEQRTELLPLLMSSIVSIKQLNSDLLKFLYLAEKFLIIRYAEFYYRSNSKQNAP